MATVLQWFRIVTRKRRTVRRTATAKSKKEFTELKEIARATVHARLEYFNKHYGFLYNKVFIRNTRTRWGSCSSRGNLGFNYRIAKLPPELQDYIVVHELCHLAEFNHSSNFWSRVAEMMPDWQARRKALHTFKLN